MARCRSGYPRSRSELQLPVRTVYTPVPMRSYLPLSITYLIWEDIWLGLNIIAISGSVHLMSGAGRLPRHCRLDCYRFTLVNRVYSQISESAGFFMLLMWVITAYSSWCLLDQYSVQCSRLSTNSIWTAGSTDLLSLCIFRYSL